MQGQIIDNDVVIKPGQIPYFYSSRWAKAQREVLKPAHVPGQLIQYDRHYTYKYVKGRQATVSDVPNILGVCESVLWHTIKTWQVPELNKNHYVRYIDGLTNFLVYPRLDALKVINEGQRLIIGTTLLCAELVHGDLTLENIIIQEDGNVVFIDPGEARRCYTPALDRGKLLQSVVMRWEERDSPGPEPVWFRPGSWPDWATELDWAFLVTHWLRLVRHWPQLPIQAGFKVLADLRPVRV